MPATARTQYGKLFHLAAGLLPATAGTSAIQHDLRVEPGARPGCPWVGRLRAGFLSYPRSRVWV
jgi:hypothetical protein